MHPSGHVLDGGDLHCIPDRTDLLWRPAAADNLQDYAFCHPNFSVLGLAAFIANLSSLVNRSFRSDSLPVLTYCGVLLPQTIFKTTHFAILTSASWVWRPLLPT